MIRAPVSPSANDIAFGVMPWTATEFSQAFTLCEPDVVLHCAGDTRNSNMRACFDANAALAGELLNAVAATSRQPRVILIGSAAEYGFVPEHSQPVKETWLCKPNTPYGVAKHAQTLLALSAGRHGLPVLVVRLFNPVGVGMPPHLALPSFVRRIARCDPGSTVEVGDLSARRDFIDVEEAARLLLELAALSHWPWPVVNLCSGQSYRIGALLDELIAASGARLAVETRAELMQPGDMPLLVGDTMRLRSLKLFPAAPDFSSLLPRLLENPQLVNGT
jgi:GDP-4-dehydro-6-deoxy-D-mannose reductase